MRTTIPTTKPCNWHYQPWKISFLPIYQILTPLSIPLRILSPAPRSTTACDPILIHHHRAQPNPCPPQSHNPTPSSITIVQPHTRPPTSVCNPYPCPPCHPRQSTNVDIRRDRCIPWPLFCCKFCCCWVCVVVWDGGFGIVIRIVDIEPIMKIRFFCCTIHNRIVFSLCTWRWKN